MPPVTFQGSSSNASSVVCIKIAVRYRTVADNTGRLAGSKRVDNNLPVDRLELNAVAPAKLLAVIVSVTAPAATAATPCTVEIAVTGAVPVFVRSTTLPATVLVNTTDDVVPPAAAV